MLLSEPSLPMACLTPASSKLGSKDAAVTATALPRACLTPALSKHSSIHGMVSSGICLQSYIYKHCKKRQSVAQFVGAATGSKQELGNFGGQKRASNKD